jgi:hypothetical protein
MAELVIRLTNIGINAEKELNPIAIPKKPPSRRFTITL